MTSTVELEHIYQRFEDYDFESDATFQVGLKSILSSNSSASGSNQEYAISNAKFFYFSRFVEKFDFTLYKEWKARKDGSSDASTSQTLQEESSSKGDDGAVSGSQGSTEPSYPASFQEICELIASGKPIPGIRQIPNELAEGTPSLSAMNPRPKPWEKTAASSE